MSLRRKVLLFVLGAAGLLSILLLILVFLAPRLINVAAVKSRVLSELERRAGVRLSYDRAELVFFPQIRLVLREVSLSVPSRAEGTVKRLEADISPLALLRNQVLIGSLMVVSPDFLVRVPERGKREEPLSLEEIGEMASRLLSGMALRAPGASFTVQDGRVTLSEGSRSPLSLRDLQASVSFPPDRLRFRLSCASPYWDLLDIEGTLRSEGLLGEARVDVSGLRPLPILERLAPGQAAFLGDSSLSLKARLESEGVRSLKADVSGTIPSLELRRKSRVLALKGAIVQGAVRLEEGSLHVSVSRLDLGAPRIRMSGTLAVERNSPRIRVEVSGQEAEIPSIRSAILSLAGDLPSVRSVLDIVRGGSISRISARVSGNSAADLGDLRALEASARLQGGTISVPGVGLTLTEVAGSVALSKGTLIGEGVTARTGGARAREGTLRLGLVQADPPFHSDFLAVADPGDLQPLLRRLVADRKFQEELDRFKDPKGSVSGRVVLGERLSSIRPIIQVTDVRMTTRYDRAPFPLTIDGGKIAYEGGDIEISDLKGALGASSFLGLTGRLVLGEAPEAGIDSGQARLSVDELVPWLSSTDLAREAFENVKSARGTVEVSSVSAGGPLGAMKEWRYEASGRVNELVLELARLPGPVTVRRGGFHLLPRSASLSGFEAELLDAKARGSADIRYSPGGISQVTASMEEGKVGAAMTEWASPRLQLAPGFGIRAPLSVSAVAFTWERDGPVSFRGDLAHPDGAVLSISLRKTPDELAIDNLVVRDQESDADLAMHLGPKELRLKYRGTLYSSTVEKFATIPARPFQRLKGDLELSVDRKSPERSVARGTLEGEEIRIPWKPLDPLLIRSVSLSADGREIRVASADLAWREVPFRLRGKGSFSRDGLEADVDVETGDVPLERLLPEPPGATETAAGSGGPPVADAGYRLPKLPVRGVFRLRSDSIRYDRWTVRSVAARGELGPAGLLVTVSEADLCGFPLRLSANLDSGGLALELRTMASGPEINPPLLCLFEKMVSMTGSFQFATRLSARGRDQESLLRSIEGPVEYTAWNGRIYKMEGLSRTLSLLNAGNVIRGQLPDLRTEGLPFDIFNIKGDYWAQVFLLREGTLHGPTLGIVWTGEIFLRTSEVNFKVLAAPFSTADWIIEHIPGLAYIMGRTLVSVPLKVEGKLGDPRVSFDTIGVGTGLLGVLERTIKLPAKVVEGALPESKPSK